MTSNLSGFKPKHKQGEAKQTSYESNEVDIPKDYLVAEPYDAKPIVFKPIDFLKTTLPEYDGAYAVVLDHVLSESECSKLIELAEASVMDKDKVGDSSWQPALVNIGAGWEILQADYRNSDRIIWDNQVIVDRMWARIEKVAGIKDCLISFNEEEFLGGGKKNRQPGSNWDFYQVNKRLRFLKYGSGQFFRPHCDGPYGELTPEGEILQTHFTVHLYLNDSRAEAGPEAELVGGATSFLSSNNQKKLDVDPKAGRVLIFQHHRLYHCGDDVLAGTKYTVRTDIMYKLRNEDGEGSAVI